MASLKKKPLPRMRLDAVRSKCHTICCEQQHAVAVQSATSPAVITMLLLLLLLLLLLWEEGGDGVPTENPANKGNRNARKQPGVPRLIRVHLTAIFHFSMLLHGCVR